MLEFFGQSPYDDMTYAGLEEDDWGDFYPQAAIQAQPEVMAAVARFRMLPAEIRSDNVLLWWLLGSGTPPYKMSKTDSTYVDKSEVFGQTCKNCIFTYKRFVTGQYICSQIRGEIKLPGWCRLWKGTL